jgi:hypothetical protein
VYVHVNGPRMDTHENIVYRKIHVEGRKPLYFHENNLKWLARSRLSAETRNDSFLTPTAGGAVRWAAPELYQVGADPNTIPE